MFGIRWPKMKLSHCLILTVLVTFVSCTIDSSAHWQALADQGLELGRQSRWQEAREVLERAVDYSKAHFSERDTRLAYSYGSLAFVTEKLGNRERANFLFEHSIQVYESSNDYDTLQYSAILLNAARCNIGTGRLDLGTKYLYRCLALRESAFGPKSDKVAEIQMELGFRYQITSPDSADFYLTKAEGIFTELSPAPTHYLVRTLIELAKARLDRRLTSDVYRLVARVDSILPFSGIVSIEDQAKAKYLLAEAYLVDSNYSKTIAESKQGLEIIRSANADGMNMRGYLLSTVAGTYARLKNFDLAAEYVDSCIAIEQAQSIRSIGTLGNLWLFRSRMERLQGHLSRADSLIALVLAIPDKEREFFRQELVVECRDLASAFAAESNSGRAVELRKIAKNLSLRGPIPQTHP